DQAAKGSFDPMDAFLSRSSLGTLTYEDHKRAWGIFEICMAEWRDPFVAMLADLRREVDFHEAFQNRMGCTPEEFHVRWVERLTGLRKTITEQRYVKPDPDLGKLVILPGDTPEQIASKIHALGVVV